MSKAWGWGTKRARRGFGCPSKWASSRPGESWAPQWDVRHSPISKCFEPLVCIKNSRNKNTQNILVWNDDVVQIQWCKLMAVLCSLPVKRCWILCPCNTRCSAWYDLLLCSSVNKWLLHCQHLYFSLNDDTLILWPLQQIHWCFKAMF